ncbi:MAG: dihydrofolate reductase family protein [Candidatus Acidiferrum sp.]
MRKIVLGLGISLDGYIARPDGSVDFLFMPKDYSMAPFFKTVDTALMGRKTYEAGVRLNGGKFSNFGLTCYVFSRTLKPGPHPGFTVIDSPVRPFVESLRKQKGKNIWHMGGGEFARPFLQDDLIDELHLGVVPILIGEGIPLFPQGFPQREFSLVENKSYSKGMITLKYARLRSKSPGH